MTQSPAPRPAQDRPATAGSPPPYDVAVLGGHLTAGLLAAVLARQGLRVLVVAAPGDGTEPAGETTVPYTAEVFLLLAKRFQVPEIAAFGLFPDLPARVKAGSGVKDSLGFLYHRPGQDQHPAETIQFNVPGEHCEWHLDRPSVDRYALELALRYGAVPVPNGARLADAGTGDGEAWVRTDDGQVHRARYLVDCAGAGSPLVGRAGDDAVPRLRHRSQVYAARMTGVTAWERLGGPREARGLLPVAWSTAAVSPWSRGTVHHLFDGGWIQLAHFGNHKDSRNRATGVTLSLDPDHAGRLDLPKDPEAAFRAVVDRYPGLRRQFAGARTVGPWTAEPLYQRTAARTHGDRWFALERSAGRNDMFLSRDVTMGVETVHALAAALVDAVRRDDFGPGPFERVARFQDALAHWNDDLLTAARTACGDFRLWNAFSRVWLLWQILAALSLKRARLEGEAGNGDWSAVEELEGGGIWFRAPGGLRELIDRALSSIEEVRSGGADPGWAADRIFADLRRAPFVPPLYAFGDPDARVYRFTLPKRLRMLLWVKTAAPKDFQRLLTLDNVTALSSTGSR
ncbi:NAD(P)/FAD-dependent oxidoreductase [Streptomyces sp.]|uniref:NAD(P)/FAD-dependent oxidoreductase n=1 Tax=Streptomyces sp. TaxID=1931 RepID=UPI002F407B47